MVQWDYAQLLYEWEYVDIKNSRDSRNRQIQSERISDGFTINRVSDVPIRAVYNYDLYERIEITYYLVDTGSDVATELCETVSQGLMHLGKAGFEMVGFLGSDPGDPGINDIGRNGRKEYLFKRPVV